MLIDDSPCKIVDITMSKTGKHGEAKGRIVAIGGFDGQKHSVVYPVKHKIKVPMIVKKNAASIEVFPLSYNGVISFLSNPIILSEIDVKMLLTSYDVRPYGSGVPTPGAYAGSKPSMSMEKYTRSEVFFHNLSNDLIYA